MTAGARIALFRRCGLTARAARELLVAVRRIGARHASGELTASQAARLAVLAARKYQKARAR